MARAGTRGDSRELILQTAISEFASKGLDGARVDSIANAAGLNKNMIYHYFGSKEQLFIAALESVYQTVRDRQQDLSIRDMGPEEGMRRLIEFTADVWIEMPEFVRLLNSENLHEARHVKQSSKIISMYNPLMDTLRELLRKGEQEGVFRSDVDPVDLYISITALSAYYVSHRHTFEAIFQTPLMTPERLEQRKATICETILRFLKRD
ncbi:TetR/AcrR family transcriptional regulator [Fodinicurvata halophila]|uniref:TetR/AcrR family transcriptional regulator n=1 Tax=Fodinicurvata halophila TaxID=1419723 RepID=A0ABV8UH85_9PROT